ncbi:MAG: sialidase family protein [Pirellulaceae bacterium]
MTTYYIWDRQLGPERYIAATIWDPQRVRAAKSPDCPSRNEQHTKKTHSRPKIPSMFLNRLTQRTLTLMHSQVAQTLLCVFTFTLITPPCSPVRGDDIVIDTSLNIETNRLFGAEHPGIYKHPASITELADGDLYMAYYGGAGEYSKDTAVYGSRREGGRTWSPPVVIADTPYEAEGNPVVWQAPDGVVWLFYVNLAGKTWSDARVKAKISRDGAVTWSDSFMISDERGSMVRGKPIVLQDGDYLLPMYHETGDDREMTADDTASYFLRYHPATGQWSESSRIRSANGNLQPQVVQWTDKDLVCYMRRGGGFGPSTSGYVLRADSHDGGRTWTDAVNTDLKNPNSAIDVERLANGHLAIVYNDHMYNRTPLTVAISTDRGKTFAFRRDIGGGDNTFAYPYMIQTRDGKILVLYTTNNRSTIMLAEFVEDAITKYVHE